MPPIHPRPFDPRAVKFIGVDVTEQPTPTVDGVVAHLFTDSALACAWAVDDAQRGLYNVHRAVMSGPNRVTARTEYDVVELSNIEPGREG